jgi:hypothetical protein
MHGRQNCPSRAARHLPAVCRLFSGWWENATPEPRTNSRSRVATAVAGRLVGRQRGVVTIGFSRLDRRKVTPTGNARTQVSLPISCRKVALSAVAKQLYIKASLVADIRDYHAAI